MILHIRKNQKVFWYFYFVQYYTQLCNKSNSTRGLIGRYQWHIDRWQTHKRRYFIAWRNSMLPRVYSVTDHRRRQNVERTSVKHSATASCATLLYFLPHLWSVTEQTHGNGIYSLIRCMVKFNEHFNCALFLLDNLVTTSNEKHGQ